MRPFVGAVVALTDQNGVVTYEFPTEPKFNVRLEDGTVRRFSEKDFFVVGSTDYDEKR